MKSARIMKSEPPTKPPARVKRLAAIPARIRPPADGSPLRLRLEGPWQQREEGFIGVAAIKTDAVDYAVDLKKMPWPIEGGVVDTIFTAFYFHRLDMDERIAFMNECYRVLKVGAQLIMQVPHWSSMRAVADPRAKWPPLSALSFAYFNKEWRANEHFDEIGITCDFDYGYGLGMDADLVVRNQEYQQTALKFYTNAAIDIHVTLTKKG